MIMAARKDGLFAQFPASSFSSAEKIADASPEKACQSKYWVGVGDANVVSLKQFFCRHFELVTILENSHDWKKQ